MKVIKDIGIFGRESPVSPPFIRLNTEESWNCRAEYRDSHSVGFAATCAKIQGYRVQHGNLPVVYEPESYRLEVLPDALIESTVRPDRSNWPEWALAALAAGWTAPKGWKP